MKRAAAAATFAMMGALLAAGSGWDAGPSYPLRPVLGSSPGDRCACPTPDPNRRGRCRRCHKDVKP